MSSSQEAPAQDSREASVTILRPLTAALLESITPAEVAAAVVEGSILVLGAEAGLVALFTEDESLEVTYTRGYAPSFLPQGTYLPESTPSPLVDAVRTTAPVFLTQQEATHPLWEGEKRFLASVSLPLAVRQRLLGVLHFSFATAPTFTETEHALLGELTWQSALALARALRWEETNSQQRNRLQRRLEQSEERFRLLVEGVQDYAIFLLDPQGCVTTWNAGAQRFKGYKSDEIIGQHFSRFYTPEDIARRHPWNELEIATREGRYEEEGWRVRKDGTRFWANVVITALRDDSGVLRGFAKVTRDVTERRDREQERRDREQEQITAQMREQQRRFLKEVLLSVTEGKLVLCDTSRDLPTPLTPTPIGEAIPLSRQSLRRVRKRVEEVAVTCALPHDKTQDLVTAASECAMNAVQHAGGGTATIYGEAGGDKVQVWVADAGKGIALAHLPRATLEPGFSTGGVGIGHGFSLMIACCQRVYLLTGVKGTTLVLEQTRYTTQPAWLQAKL